MQLRARGQIVIHISVSTAQGWQHRKYLDERHESQQKFVKYQIDFNGKWKNSNKLIRNKKNNR